MDGVANNPSNILSFINTGISYIYGLHKGYIWYRKRRKFWGVFNFVIFADATIPRNLILGQRQFTQLSVQMAGTRIDYNAERSQ